MPASSALSENLPAAQVISHYSGDEWEKFVAELVEGLSADTSYVLVKNMGGPRDMGIDVAGFKSTQGFESSWHGYQCKQYAKPLSPAMAWVEILKVFRAIVADECVTPESYIFMAPKGVSLSLNKLLRQPSKAKTEFNEWLKSYVPSPEMTDSERNLVESVVADTDFSIFDAMQPREIITLHSKTRYHSLRFSAPLPDRNVAVPDDLGKLTGEEARYVDQLVAVYRQRHPNDVLTRETVADHPERGGHFRRQRRAFFRAETLRVYARESTPPGTFDNLQDDLHAGVVEVAEDDHVDGYTRVQSVLAASGLIDLANHRLIEKADHEDRKGICHQLVNEDRLTWIEDQK